MVFGNRKLRRIFSNIRERERERTEGWTKLRIEEFTHFTKIFRVKKIKDTRLVVHVAHV